MVANVLIKLVAELSRAGKSPTHFTLFTFLCFNGSTNTPQ